MGTGWRLRLRLHILLRECRAVGRRVRRAARRRGELDGDGLRAGRGAGQRDGSIWRSGAEHLRGRVIATLKVDDSFFRRAEM